jgi:hypothetical protein
MAKDEVPFPSYITDPLPPSFLLVSGFLSFCLP